MRIGYTDYYTITKHLMVQDSNTKKIHSEEFKGYALSVYGKTERQIWNLVADLRYTGIRAQRQNFIGRNETPLPHILIIQRSAVEKLEKLFQTQGIQLDPHRYDEPTDWEKVLHFEELKHRTKLQKLNATLRNKKNYLTQTASNKTTQLWTKIKSALSK